jgi:hypothetical protein
VTAVALVLAAVPPARAGTMQVATSQGPVAVTVPDVTWVEDGCMDVPLTATAAVASGVSWQAEVAARRSGSGTGVSGGVLGNGPGTEESSLLLCPTTNGSGTYTATVTVEARDYGRAGEEGWESTGTGTTSFTVSRMRSTTAVTSVRLRSTTTRVKGRVTVRSAEFGTIGADFETVRIQVREPGSSRWRGLGDGFTDEMGRFTVTDYRARPAGTRFRASFAGDAVADDSRSDPVRG